MTQHHAHITNGIVDFVLRVEPRTVFADPYASEFVACPQGVAVGWLHDGTVFSPPVMDGVAVLPDVVPTSCTPAQGLIALYALKGLTEQQILDVIAQIPDSVQRYTAQIGYSRAITWERESQTMQAMAALLSLSEQDLDDLFASAAGVEI